MNFSELDSFMKQMPERGFPACEIAVTKDGETVYRQSVGFADPQKTRPASANDIYWIFSATKVITCIAAMRLVEQGKMALSDPLSKYIPEFKSMNILRRDGSTVPAENAITLENLFTMTAGMTYDFKSQPILEAMKNDPSTLGIVRAMAKVPLVFEPGTHYRYSLCHDVLAAVVEVVAGMKFSEYLRKYVFDPLGIKDMGFRPDDAQKARFSAMYNFKNGTAKPIERTVENEYAFSPEYESGGAGLFATVDEYTKIISVIACGGTTADGYTLLKPETIQSMTVNRLCDDALNDFITTRLYGYGWGLCGRAHMNPTLSMSRSPAGEFGWDGAAAAFNMIDTVNRVALCFGTHIKGCSYAYHMIHPTLRNLVYECLEQ